MARKYFGTDGVRGKVGVNPITPEFAMKMGNAVGQALREKRLPLVVVIGQDTRRSSDMLKAGFIAGITAVGVNVINLGMVPTPVVAFMVPIFKAGAGVVLSASHNPFYDNGIKLFSSEGHKLPDDVEYQIERYIDEEFYYQPEGEFGEIYSQINEVKPYIKHCLTSFADQINLSDKKIIVDCANGALFRVAKEVFSRLNLNTVNIASNPDGLNINENCGAVHLDALKTAVINQNADLGIAFDGDGDRIMLVDETGCVVDGDDILLALAKYNENIPGVVGTVMTNLAIEQEFSKLNLPFKRAKVGDRYVMELLLENNWALGGESSGHIIDLRYNSTGDGLMAALQILALLTKTNKPLSMLADSQKMPQLMINVPLTKKLDANDMSLLIEDVSFVEKTLGDDGRVVLRPSGTEPVLRVMVEAKTVDLTKKWVDYLVEKVKEKLNA
ncbi:phosphoglucosamine mutase [Cysteiniphilum sp. QT6929]|uniref:phosphoglucosamine mutase n=1 Tax=Cysteiniphilum sp. QT6929 TaxID=2975055 RepID=UPI0024B3B904|nr:phosphoglucosamine mutase [Cysteiniphilum sp. QT6929]WHN65142.1 phosphoglucosamine mutase [Cysteiniphilum sp. QT6929]